MFGPFSSNGQASLTTANGGFVEKFKKFMKHQVTKLGLLGVFIAVLGFVSVAAWNKIMAKPAVATEGTKAQLLVEMAKEEMAKKAYDVALGFLDQAAKLEPKNEEIQSLIKKTKEGKVNYEKTAEERKKLLEEKAKKETYEAAIVAGRKALSDKKFDDALKQFEIALKNKPGDELANDLLAKADVGSKIARLEAKIRNGAPSPAKKIGGIVD